MYRRFLFDTGANDNAGNTEKVEPLIGEVDKSVIAGWKAKYPLGVYHVISAEGHVVYFKNPNRNEVNCAMSKQSIATPLAPLEELATLTFIGGSEEALKNDNIALGIYNKIQSKLDGIPAVLVNL